jgi:hypothetical protein
LQHAACQTIFHQRLYPSEIHRRVSKRTESVNFGDDNIDAVDKPDDETCMSSLNKF